jgi:glutamate dehydrogenase (NADP+)
MKPWKGKTCLVSGSGNVAQYTMEKLLDLGGKVVTLSDSSGYIYDEDGHRPGQTGLPDQRLKNMRRGRVRNTSRNILGQSTPRPDPDPGRINPLWDHKADCAFPSRHPERNQRQGRRSNLVRQRREAVVSEGANMPTVPRRPSTVPGQTSCSMAQARPPMQAGWRYPVWKWPRTACAGLDPRRGGHRLQMIMKSIHQTCLDAAAEYGTPGNYMNGANIAGFVKVVNAMLDQGVV